MKKNTILLILSFLLVSPLLSAQTNKNEDLEVTGIVQNSADDKLLSRVHIINLNSVKGVVSNQKGEFKINAKVNDTLYFTYLGFEPQKEVVTNDWVKYGNVNVAMTEIGIALQEVVVSGNNLTGFIEIDIKNIPIYTNTNRYAISGLNAGYEGTKSPSGISRAVKAIINPITSVYNVFARKPNELKKLRKVKEDDEIRNLLQDKFDRETLATLLQLNQVDIDEILRQCNYSKQFVKTANDLQILDAISECYDEYKVLNR